MKDNPPAADDAPMVREAREDRHRAGPGFRQRASSTPTSQQRVPQLAFDRIMLHFKFSGGDVQDVNGWAFTTKTGLYGTNYLQRALVTAIGLGANRPQDAVYPTSPRRMPTASAYDGANKYVIRFPQGQLPPVDGFWSLTMYDENFFFVANPINRYSISARADLKANAGRLGRALHAERLAGHGQGGQLAAGAGREVHAHAADLLAGRERSVDPQCDLADAGGQEGRLTRTRPALGRGPPRRKAWSGPCGVQGWASPVRRTEQGLLAKLRGQSDRGSGSTGGKQAVGRAFSR